MSNLPPTNNWLNLGAIVQVAGGTPLPREPFLNLIGGGWTAVDNPTNPTGPSTDLTAPGSPGAAKLIQLVNAANSPFTLLSGYEHWVNNNLGAVTLELPSGWTLGMWFAIKLLCVPSPGAPITLVVPGGGKIEIPIGEGSPAASTLNTFTTTTLAFTAATDQGAGYLWKADGSNNFYL
jgi:hypothetical protein